MAPRERHFQHLFERDLLQALGLGHNARIGGVDAVDVGVDVAAICVDRRRDRHRRGVRSAASQRGDASGLLVDALETGNDGHFLALLEALDQLLAVDVEDARRAVDIAGQDRNLPALPGACFDAHRLQRDRQKAGGHLFARGDHGVVFAGVVHRRGLRAPADQLVGLAGHGRDHDGDLMAGVDLALDVARDVANALDIGDGSAAEFHDETGHWKIRNP